MGLISDSLSLDDQAIIRDLSTEIVQTMRRASECLDTDISMDFSHPWNYLCWFWFGLLCPRLITKLKITLNRMASIINLHPVHVGYIWPNYSDENSIASSIKPLSSWRDNTENIRTGAIAAGAFITRSENEMFYILLDHKWIFTHKYTICTERHHQGCGSDPIEGFGISSDACTGIHDSQFQTIVHELTHLILNTKDHVYGYQECLDLALESTDLAWKNADNWGYFLEEFRLHKLMAH